MSDSASVVVCVARVMDTSSPVDFAQLLTGKDASPEPQALELNWILNPADEAAVRMVRSLPGYENGVLALHVGAVSGDTVLRDAIAHGAGSAVRLELPSDVALDAVTVAEALSGYLKSRPPPWVLCGQATLDWNTGLVAPLLAELLDRPLLDQVTSIASDGDTVRCVRIVGKGVRETVRVQSPAVLAVSSLAFQSVAVPVRAQMRAERATIRVEPARTQGTLARPVRRETTRPRPRPKESLPADFGSMSPETRLAMLIQANQPAANSSRRVLTGEPADLASELLKAIEDAGYDWRRACRLSRIG